MDITSLINADVYQHGTGTVLGKCRDLLLDSDAGKITYIYLETGGWLAPAHALFAVARLSLDGTRLALSATPAEVTERSEGQAQAEGAPDPADMPPIVVGPFGDTVSPMMAATLIDAFRARDPNARPEPEGKGSRFQWFTHLQGVPVFDPSGFLGDVSDIVLRPDDLSCVFLKTNNGGQHRLFPFDKIRQITQNGQSVILKSHQPDTALARALETLGAQAQRG